MNTPIFGGLFSSIWLVDYEFYQPDGEKPLPLCVVAKDLLSGNTIRKWLEGNPISVPFNIGEDSLFISYYSTAEFSCHNILGWELPAHVIDFYAEFKNLTCGLQVPSGHGLLGALTYFGLPGIASLDKQEMRDLAMRGGPYSALERQQLIEYCESDVSALEKLFPKMLPTIDLPRALIRGRYMKALSKVEYRGVPIDMNMHETLVTRWDDIKDQLIAEVDKDYGVYDNGTFIREKFLKYCENQNIPWPMLVSGIPALDEDTFKDMAKSYPQLYPLKELRVSLSKLRLSTLSVGKDGRNRCILSAFKSRTGRNQPSNSKFIFGPATWIRNLIKPPEGRGVAYVDWSSQEFGIAAYLSKDKKMMDAYRSGDPYLYLAKLVGAVPKDATKQTHGAVRDRFKVCTLGVQYGLSAVGLGKKLGESTAHGRELLDYHKAAFRDFWSWNNNVRDTAFLMGKLSTVYGWNIYTGVDANPRSMTNFPVQGNGAEMMRLAVIFCEEMGVEVIAPVHDALLIEFDKTEEEEKVSKCRQAMELASTHVLPGFPLRTDYKVFYDTFSDERGKIFWDKLQTILQLEQGGINESR